MIGIAIQNRYRILHILGTGSFAVVYLAIDLCSKRQVAVKCLNKTNLDQRQLDTQKREIHFMKVLNNHPFIVHLIDVIETRDNIFLIMEHCEMDLYEAITQKGGFPEEVVKEVFLQLIDAIAHCHFNGIYHRDIKPENCLISSDYTLKLTDFGLSTTDTWSFEFGCGSVRYMAPECLSDPQEHSPTCVNKKNMNHDAGSSGSSSSSPDIHTASCTRTTSTAKCIQDTSKARNKQSDVSFVRKLYAKEYLNKNNPALSERSLGERDSASKDPITSKEKGYSPARNDIWSMGIILINLLFGKNPWHEASMSDPLYSLFVTTNPNILQDQFDLTNECNHMLKIVFHKNPCKRFSLHQLKHHIINLPFFTRRAQQQAMDYLSSVHSESIRMTDAIMASIQEEDEEHYSVADTISSSSLTLVQKSNATPISSSTPYSPLITMKSSCDSLRVLNPSESFLSSISSNFVLHEDKKDNVESKHIASLHHRHDKGVSNKSVSEPEEKQKDGFGMHSFLADKLFSSFVFGGSETTKNSTTYQSLSEQGKEKPIQVENSFSSMECEQNRDVKTTPHANTASLTNHSTSHVTAKMYVNQRSDSLVSYFSDIANEEDEEFMSENQVAAGTPITPKDNLHQFSSFSEDQGFFGDLPLINLTDGRHPHTNIDHTKSNTFHSSSSVHDLGHPYPSNTTCYDQNQDMKYHYPSSFFFQHSNSNQKQLEQSKNGEETHPRTRMVMFSELDP